MKDRDPRQEQQPTRPTQQDQAATNNSQQASTAQEKEPSLAEKAIAFIDKHWGQDARAWFRQGAQELAAATVAFPGQTIHQPTPYGGLFQPPPSTVARALTEEQENRGNVHQQDQGNSSQQERGSVHGNDQPQEQGNAPPQNRGSVHGNGQPQTYSIDDLRAMGRELRQQQENAREQQHDHQQDRDNGR